ncbi:hypothetical protein HNQ57_003314 [Zhongshania antarctica]|uniref:Uncharacterized protein n=1 Tax=Zhongshania antarctica TaxID=641702 RepID=A0A840R6Y9_9GAMM|nr:hypothetical protein [Zhongshania antarctica]
MSDSYLIQELSADGYLWGGADFSYCKSSPCALPDPI